jgi:hypothetical protein
MEDPSRLAKTLAWNRRACVDLGQQALQAALDF